MYAVWALISAYSLPLSRTSVSARATDLWVTRSASRRSRAPRFDAVSRGHSPEVNAACAARTARSASAAVPRGINAHGSPRYGLSLSKTSPEPASIHSPPTYIRYRVRVEVVAMRGGPPEGGHYNEI